MGEKHEHQRWRERVKFCYKIVIVISPQLTSFLARTADETKIVPVDQHYYRSLCNSLIVRKADRTPKMFALQGDPSRPTSPPSSKRSPYIVSRGRP
ncbi:hypothetical protein AVEN_235036-1 [Araneus ventricosus]|uniref:Uncharacterized protein n=1 Tax=Araneus ventricosus TaxID=182803 RepID=A0A4Y2BWI3_ARAVE|nr:hypothetical protein AVEN_235036-1 [Araneus ventricosus]